MSTASTNLETQQRQALRELWVQKSQCRLSAPDGGPADQKAAQQDLDTTLKDAGKLGLTVLARELAEPGVQDAGKLLKADVIIAEAISEHLSSAERAMGEHQEAARDVLEALKAAGWEVVRRRESQTP